VPVRPYVRFAGERREPSRGVDGLREVVPDDAEVFAESPGVWYKSPNNIMLEFWVISNGSEREDIARKPREYLSV
jgi:IMP cyclohydrolase